MDLERAIFLSQDGFLTFDEVAALCAEVRADQAEALDAISRDVAKRYMNGELPFETADTLMNSVWGYGCTVGHVPQLMRAIYEAFDAGEYHHRGDPEGADPEIKYTRPMLNRILSR